jgi:hypothetical protein
MQEIRFIKIWRIVLGIATEIAMTVFIMAVAFGLSWVISK